MAIIIAKNVTAGEVFLEDMGIGVPASPGQITMSDLFDLNEISNSIDLQNAVSVGDLVINNGTTDLSITGGLKYISLELSPGVGGGWSIGNTPPLTPADGEGYYNSTSGLMAVYDGVRGLWLSVTRQFIMFGKSKTAKNEFLRFNGGSVASNRSGIRLEYNAVMTSITTQLRSAGTATIEIRRNNVNTSVYSEILSNVQGQSTPGLNVPLLANDYLQCYIGNTSGVKYPMVKLEIAWNLS